MGHVRIGFLPHTKQGNAIVEQLAQFGGDADVVLSIANDILTAINKTYTAMPFDESVRKVIMFLATLAFSAKQSNQIAYLKAICRMVKKLLKKYDYPLEGYDEAIATVIGQCEMWTDS